MADVWVLTSDVGNLTLEVSTPKRFHVSIFKLRPGTEDTYDPTDPDTLTLTLTNPVGNGTAYGLDQLIREGVGQYSFDFSANAAGQWLGSWQVTSPTASVSFLFTAIDPFASLPPVPIVPISPSDLLTFPSFEFITGVIGGFATYNQDVIWSPVASNRPVFIRQTRLEPSADEAIFDFKVLRQGDYGSGVDTDYAFWATNIQGTFMREFIWDYQDEDNTSKMHLWIRNTSPIATTVRVLLNNRIAQ